MRRLSEPINSRSANLFGRFAAPACPPATMGSLSATCCATAAAILQKVLQVIPPIVVSDFLARLYSAQSYDHDATPASDWFCIRLTGMIDVTGKVPSRRAIDSPSLVDLELIFGAACLTPIGFYSGNAPAAIGRNVGFYTCPSFRPGGASHRLVVVGLAVFCRRRQRQTSLARRGCEVGARFGHFGVRMRHSDRIAAWRR
jgi:hypothetical protein